MKPYNARLMRCFQGELARAWAAEVRRIVKRDQSGEQIKPSQQKLRLTQSLMR